MAHSPAIHLDKTFLNFVSWPVRKDFGKTLDSVLLLQKPSTKLTADRLSWSMLELQSLWHCGVRDPCLLGGSTPPQSGLASHLKGSNCRASEPTEQTMSF